MTTAPSATAAQFSIPKLIGLGLSAAFFFSATFVLNRAISQSGGHWVWTATLRYFFMILLFAGWIVCRPLGAKRLLMVFREFRTHMNYWLRAGGIGFGLFYAGICFAADKAPGWIIAATWQLTVIASPLVLLWFHRRVPIRGVFFMLLIFFGVSMLNINQLNWGASLDEVVWGFLPVLASAFCYPYGNQMLNEAKHSRPDLSSLGTAAHILLMTLGSLPIFVILVLVSQPPPPTPGQITNTFIVAISSGFIATMLFYYARHQSNDPYRIAAVDATQAGEAVFTLVGEIVFLNAAFPDSIGALGLLVFIAGFVGFFLYTTDSSTKTATDNC